MKIIAFLCCLMIGFMVQNDVMAFRDQTFETPHTTFEYSRDAEGHALLSADGKHTFTVTLGCDDIKFYVNDVVVDGEHYVAYGFVSDNSSEQFYDAFYAAISETGNVLHTQILQYDSLSEVKDVYDLAGTAIYKINRNIVTQAGYETIGHTLITLDDAMAVAHTLDMEDYIKTARIEEDKVYFAASYQSEAHSAIDASLNLYERGIVYGISNHADYEGHVHAEFVGVGLLGGVSVVNQISIDYPGHYVFEYEDYTYRFTVHPTVSGVSDGMKTADPVRIEYSDGLAFLNHDLYVSGTRIDTPGYHTLSIEGDNNYVHQVRFTITGNIEGVYDGRSYDEARTITFQGNGYLNNRFIESGISVEEAGHYTLRIEGVNGYTEVIHFEILEPSIENTHNQALLAVEIGVLATALISGATLYLRHRKRKT